MLRGVSVGLRKGWRKIAVANHKGRKRSRGRDGDQIEKANPLESKADHGTTDGLLGQR